MNTQAVNVTAEHIERGLRGDCLNCPAALALQESTNEGVWEVGEYTACFNVRNAYGLSPDLIRIIADFDTTGTMSPLTLIIDHDAKTITVQQ